MSFTLSEQQQKFALGVKHFVNEVVAPNAHNYDLNKITPTDCLGALADYGYMGAQIPSAFGGMELDAICFGNLCKELGSASASILSLITVHSMVCFSIARWANSQLKQNWLPKLASGEKIAAFALTEPNVGSSVKDVETRVEADGDSYVLNGTKTWISYAQIANVFLVFAKVEDQPVALLVERDSPGLDVEPLQGLIGLQASMMGKVKFTKCRISKDNLIARPGFGISHVASSCLDLGRLSIAWGSLGISEACLAASLSYSSNRSQGGQEIKNYQLIQEMIADMVTNVHSSRLLCQHASWLRDNGDPDAIMETCIAKYSCSRIASKCASDALQVHGALGCSLEHPVQRYWRDARMMEIIEGSSQIQQMLIANFGYQNNPDY